MIVYATSSQLATWTGVAAPANADVLLRWASALVAAAAGQDLYGAAPTGTTAEALRDATTAQAAAWIALGVTPSSTMAGATKRSGIGSATVEYDTTEQAKLALAIRSALAGEAEAILLAADLLVEALPVWTFGDDRLLDYGLGGTWPVVVSS